MKHSGGRDAASGLRRSNRGVRSLRGLIQLQSARLAVHHDQTWPTGLFDQKCVPGRSMGHRAGDLVLLSRRTIELGAIVFRFRGGEVLRSASSSPSTDFMQCLIRNRLCRWHCGALVFVLPIPTQSDETKFLTTCAHGFWTVMTRFLLLTFSHVFTTRVAPYSCIPNKVTRSTPGAVYNDSREPNMVEAMGRPSYGPTAANGGKAGRSPTVGSHRTEGCVSFHSRNWRKSAALSSRVMLSI